MAGEVLYLPLT